MSAFYPYQHVSFLAFQRLICDAFQLLTWLISAFCLVALAALRFEERLPELENGLE
jgi:hypothetical protein